MKSIIAAFENEIADLPLRDSEFNTETMFLYGSMSCAFTEIAAKTHACQSNNTKRLLVDRGAKSFRAPTEAEFRIIETPDNVSYELLCQKGGVSLFQRVSPEQPGLAWGMLAG